MGQLLAERGKILSKEHGGAVSRRNVPVAPIIWSAGFVEEAGEKSGRRRMW